MVYTKKTPWTLILGIIMLAYGFAIKNGALDSALALFHTTKHADEMVTLSLLFGGIAVVVGLMQAFMKFKPGHSDYFISTVGGVIFILLIAFVVKWYAAPIFAYWGKAAAPTLGWNFAKILGFNHVVLGIIAGIITVNVFKIPFWADNGVRLSRLGLKSGVILLGALYSAQELRNLAGLSVVLIGFFVLGSVGMVLWLGRLRRIPNSMGGVLSAGIGVCGVSAAVASAPVVRAKSTEIAYTIGTILLWGVFMMFIFPVVGRLTDMGYVQFGAWAGTGILNSAQVAGAALSFQPTGIETLKVAEIFNITRVLFLPIIVLWLAVWYVKQETGAKKVNIGEVIIGKFPIFVLGFILLFALSSTGIFAPPQHYKGKYFDNNIAASKLLSYDEIATLSAESDKIKRRDQNRSLSRLINNRKVMSVDDDDAVRGLVNSNVLSKKANKILKKAHKAVRHTAKRVKAFRNFIVWFFAFGLIGLGMQITMKSIKQAGGQPLVIGTTVGLTKAVGSFLVIYFLIKETI